jgi:hypothetical protein
MNKHHQSILVVTQQQQSTIAAHITQVFKDKK